MHNWFHRSQGHPSVRTFAFWLKPIDDQLLPEACDGLDPKVKRSSHHLQFVKGISFVQFHSALQSAMFDALKVSPTRQK